MSLESNTPQPATSIPLSDPRLGRDGEPTIGALVKDATEHASDLFRAEIELAKAEAIAEVKKAGISIAFFVICGAVLLYSSFFFFFFLAELLDEWLPSWAAYGIVFLIMVLIAVIAGLIGYIVVKKVTGPRRTIASVKAASEVLPGRHEAIAPPKRR